MFQFLVWGWAGLIVGVSFIATPAKFLTPSLDLQQALDVGRSTFFVLKWVEAMLVVLLTLLLLKIPLSNISRLLCVVLILVVVVQYLAVLPVLDARVELILQGQALQKSNLHHVYVGIELLKVSLLVLAGYLAHRVG